MTVAKCRKCKKEISTKDKKCPHCGVKNPVIPTWQALLIFVLISFALISLFSDDDREETRQATSVKEMPRINGGTLHKSNKKEVESLFKSNKEKTAMDALWTDDNVFKVAVYNDGSNRDGYAQYVCLTLKEYQLATKTLVRIVDYEKLQKGQWDNIGTALCK